MISARRVRTVLAWLLRSPLARLVGPSMLLLDRSGRRSYVPLLYAPAGVVRQTHRTPFPTEKPIDRHLTQPPPRLINITGRS